MTCYFIIIVLEALVQCCNLKQHVTVGYILSMDTAFGVQRPPLISTRFQFDFGFVYANHTKGDLICMLNDSSKYLILV